MPEGSDFEFESEVTGGAIPKNLIPAVGAGIREGMERGGRYGFPVVDVRAVCTDGKHHSVDSSEMSFKMAGSLALRAALDTAGVEVLEPVSRVDLEVRAAHQGDVLGDLSARRAQILSSETVDGVATIQALVPSAEIVRYAIDLRSMTGGSGTFAVEHHGYQQLPANLVERVAADAAAD